MADRRVERGVRRGQRLEIEVDGAPLVAYEGETIATALVAAGRRLFHRSARTGAPRAMYCGIGLCFDCIMVIDGVPNTRACQTPATPGCRIQTQDGLEAGR